jgi:hypothetical protein
METTKIVNTLVVQQVMAPVDDGLDGVRAYMSGAALDAATEQKVKEILAANVAPKETIERTLDYTYYPNGDVDIITVTLTDTVSAKVVKSYQIKHYQDGTAPRQL